MPPSFKSETRTMNGEVKMSPDLCRSCGSRHIDQPSQKFLKLVQCDKTPSTDFDSTRRTPPWRPVTFAARVIPSTKRPCILAQFKVGKEKRRMYNGTDQLDSEYSSPASKRFTKRCDTSSYSLSPVQNKLHFDLSEQQFLRPYACTATPEFNANTHSIYKDQSSFPYVEEVVRGESMLFPPKLDLKQFFETIKDELPNSEDGGETSSRLNCESPDGSSSDELDRILFQGQAFPLFPSRYS